MIDDYALALSTIQALELELLNSGCCLKNLNEKLQVLIKPKHVVNVEGENILRSRATDAKLFSFDLYWSHHWWSIKKKL